MPNAVLRTINPYALVAKDSKVTLSLSAPRSSAVSTQTAREHMCAATSSAFLPARVNSVDPMPSAWLSSIVRYASASQDMVEMPGLLVLRWDVAQTTNVQRTRRASTVNVMILVQQLLYVPRTSFARCIITDRSAPVHQEPCPERMAANRSDTFPSA